MKKLKIIFAGGGTGGHLYPALAIADRLKTLITPGCEADFRFVGTKRGIEYRMKERLGYPLSLITVRGLSRRGIIRNILFPFLLAGATLKSIYLILRFSPNIVIGTGGYVMGPVLLAAVMMNRRSAIQEQNSYPGVTTRQLAHRVDKVFLGFGEAAKYFKKGCDVLETGNPVKSIIGTITKEDARKYFDLSIDDKVILILGGSQGASSINNNILMHLETLSGTYRLIWQTGERDYKEVAAKAGGRVSGRALFAFTDQIETAYAAADIAIARAGALTLAELEAAGLPSVLIPYPFAAEDHQRKNAEVYAAAGASFIIYDNELGEMNLLKGTITLLEDGSRDKMKAALETLRSKRKKPAVDKIAEEILALTGFERGNN
ncbi:MAG: undecaprenyldiphospho-muramoylpentapeptide beta-N-acetylglucosaminyltransferase [Candidatus Zixiibacteriota bacterium]